MEFIIKGILIWYRGKGSLNQFCPKIVAACTQSHNMARCRMRLRAGPQAKIVVSLRGYNLERFVPV